MDISVMTPPTQCRNISTLNHSFQVQVYPICRLPYVYSSHIATCLPRMHAQPVSQGPAVASELSSGQKIVNERVKKNNPELVSPSLGPF